MPLFRYEALDRNGKTVVGAMQAASEQEVFGRLSSMGYNPVLAQSAPMDAPPAAPVATQPRPPVARAPRMPGVVPQPAAPPMAVGSVPAYRPAPAGPKSKLSASKRSIARMFHQLHIAVRAGMPIFQAVSTVSAQVPEAPLRQMLYELSLGVRDGLPVSDLMEGYPRLFTRGDVGMLRAAEMGGFLPEAFRNLALQHEQDDNAQRRLRIFVWFFHSSVAMAILSAPLGFFVVPAIAAGFNFMAGARAVGRIYLLAALPLLAAYFGFLAWFQWARNNPDFARAWHRRLLRLPNVGRINDLRAKAVFTRVLQQLVHIGIPLPMAWQTAAFAIPNLHLADVFLQGMPVVEGTARLSAAMQQIGVMDPADIGMVATGEATGEIAQSLEYLADRYEEENRVALGAGVMRGAISFTVWAFLVGLISSAVVEWAMVSSGGGIFKAVEKGMGLGD